jgi:transcriptional regulator with XRE-family HTH domain
MSDILNQVGNRIKEIRKARGWSQDQLGEKCGFHFSYIGGVERGERNVSLQNLAVIADTLEVDMQSFFQFERQSGEEKEAIIQEVIALLSKREMRHIQLARKILAEIFEAFP